MNEANKERRIAELEFVASAYSSEEAWCEAETNRRDETISNNDNHHGSRVHRRLDLTFEDHTVHVRLTLTLPLDYPMDAPLHVSATVDDSTRINSCPTILVKTVYNALPELAQSCHQAALDNAGEESVFVVLNRADEWILDQWPRHCGSMESTTMTSSSSPTRPAISLTLTKSMPRIVLGRRLIYSHHIISKIKRADIKRFASHYNLTGYMKIGWPGLIIIEGNEEECIAFYDEIRPWSWQYLVVRGEQQEPIPPGTSLESRRCFSSFQEVDDISVVAQHCRQVGLEALFRTSMKVYEDTGMDNSGDQANSSNGIKRGNYDDSHPPNYGALVHVDHMNNGKAYRKWLRKASQETDCSLMIKQCYPHQDFTQRPKIMVGVVGDRATVSAFLKRWRTCRVDVDAQGRPCLERQMSILVEGELVEGDWSLGLDWDQAMAEESVNLMSEQLLDLASSIGGDSWKMALEEKGFH